MIKKFSVLLLSVLLWAMSAGNLLQAMKRTREHQINPTRYKKIKRQAAPKNEAPRQEEERIRQEKIRRAQEERNRQQQEENARKYQAQRQQGEIRQQNEQFIKHFPHAAAMLRQGMAIDDVIQDYPHLILGVNANVSYATIKKVYFGLVRKYHPDKNVNEPEPIILLATRITQIINDAFAEITK